MFILSLDSTAQTASVALSENDKFLAGVTLNIGNKHSTTLLPAVEFVMKQAGKKAGDVDMFALTAGPGSFTGVRIGAATVKGLALGRNVPCIGVSSLETMARGAAASDGLICAMINARRDRYFAAYFTADHGKITRLADDDTLDGADVEKYLAGYAGNVYLVGDGAEVFLRSHAAENAVPVPEILKYPNAYYAGVIAKEIFDLASDTDRAAFTADALRPEYLRQPQAERELNERLNNK